MFFLLMPGILSSAAGGANPELIVSGQITTSSGISFSDLRSAGAEDGDTLIFFESNDTGNPSTPTGFTSLYENLDSSPEAMISYKVLETSDTGSTDYTAFSGQTDASGVYAIVRNAGALSINTPNSVLGTSMTFNDKTTTEGSLLFAVVHLDDDEISDIADWNDPSNDGWTKSAASASNQGSNGSSTYIATATATGGTENPGTVTLTGANDEYHALVVEVAAPA